MSGPRRAYRTYSDRLLRIAPENKLKPGLETDYAELAINYVLLKNPGYTGLYVLPGPQKEEIGLEITRDAEEAVERGKRWRGFALYSRREVDSSWLHYLRPLEKTPVRHILESAIIMAQSLAGTFVSPRPAVIDNYADLVPGSPEFEAVLAAERLA